MTSKGLLRVYLGCAPGVGKSFAMLGEGLRRSERGTEVAIGALHTKGRQPLVALASRLRDISRDGDLDLSRVLDERPSVVLIDELAGPASTTGGSSARWEDVQVLLDAGIDVLTTLNIEQLESLRDVATEITGRPSGPGVPDWFVRSGQFDLVDMSPESLRRRLAHGNVFPPEQVDAELADYFRVGNLTALRELALSWLADRVEEELGEYVTSHKIGDTWETRERIVVALTGAAGSDAVVRRAGRLAARTKAQLLGVHVVPLDGMRTRGGPELDAHRALLVSLGGSYHEIIGDDIGTSLVEFAAVERATQLVIGASPQPSRRSPRRWWRREIADEIVRRADGIDVPVVALPRPAASGRLELPGRPHARRPRRAISRQREVNAWLLLVLGLPILAFVLLRFPEHVGVSAVLLLFLTLVLTIAAIGGVIPGMVAALSAFLVSNWFFVPPRHTFAISSGENLVALLVFVGVAAAVSALVDRMSIRSSEALLARAEAETLARTTATIAGERDPLDHLMGQICSAFHVTGAALLSSEPGGTWHAEAGHGEVVPSDPAAGVAIALDEGGTDVLVLSGAVLSADDHRVLRTIASQLRLALDARQYQESAARLDALAEANAVRTAMLQAVSHDLRTPLAAIKASASSLLSSDVEWAPESRQELLATIDQEADRLNRIVGNLLDMSRLQAGAVRVRRRPTPVAEIVDNALASLSGIDAGRAIDVDVDDELAVDADGALVERAVANVVSNALAHVPGDMRVRVEALAVRSSVHIRVVDRGPGIPQAQRTRVFEPFQRLGDRGGAGVGLGLAVARGLIIATGGRIELDDTPGGGLTVTIVLPRARVEVPG